MADVNNEFFRAVIYYSIRNTILGHESQCSWPRIYHFLGPFAKLRRRLLCSSCLSFPLPVRMRQLDSHCTDFH